MKRIIVVLLLVALTAGAAQAQVGVYRSGGAIKKEKKEHREKREREEQERERERLERELYEQQERERQKKLMQERLEAERVAKEKAEKRRQERREYRRNLEWTNSIVLNYSLTLLGGTSNVGLTYARCKFGGFYINAMSGLEWHTANVNETEYDNYHVYDFSVTNKKSHPRISFTVGGVIKVAKTVFAYAGAGYAYRGLNYKTTNGKWVQYHKGEYNLGNCADLEFGLIGNIKGFTLQFGYSILLSGLGHANEIKFGVGYSFGSKKQKQPQEQKQEEMEVIENE